MVPVVTSYKYLGLVFQSGVEVSDLPKRMATERKVCLTRAYYAMRGFLSYTTIPLSIQTQVTKASLLPVATYGGELWGMCKTRCAGVQKELNKVMRTMVGIWQCADKRGSPEALSRELGISSIHEIGSGARARLWSKSPTLKTVLRELQMNPMKSKSETWVTGSTSGIKLYSKGVEGFPKDFSLMKPEDLCTKLRNAISEDEKRKHGEQKVDVAAKKSFTVYLQSDYFATRAFIDQSVGCLHLAQGVKLLVQCRVGGFLTGSRAKHFSGLVDSMGCQSCRRDDMKCSLPHILLRCRMWVNPRKTMFSKLRHLETAVIFDSFNRLPVGSQTAMLLGGKVGELRFEHWLGDPQSVQEPGFKIVAEFLMSVYDGLKQHIGESMIESRGPKGHGNLLNLAEPLQESEEPLDLDLDR